jgi:RNA recognition motif-containing protein
MTNIYVGNCSYDLTDDQLRELFATYGEVEQVSIIRDRETGRSRGFAFVEMPDSAAARAAIEGVNGTELDGRALKVNEARPKTDRGGGGGRRDW